MKKLTNKKQLIAFENEIASLFNSGKSKLRSTFIQKMRIF